MNRLATWGRWLFVIPFFVFGFLHFGPTQFTLPYVPSFLPAPLFWVYFAGVALMLFAVSAAIGRLDRLAAVLLAVELVLFVVLIHLPKAIGGDFMGVIATLRDTCMAGAALVYAGTLARDTRFVSV